MNEGAGDRDYNKWQLGYSLTRLMDASKEHEDARDGYEGRSWDYHGAGLIYEVQKAQEDFVDRLQEIIDARVTELMAAAQTSTLKDANP